MKRVVMGVMVLLGIGTMSAHAQSITYGVKAEANMSNYIVKDGAGVKSDLGFGATVGGFAKFDITRGFAIQPELLFNYQNSDYKLKATGQKYNLEYWGVEVPVYAMGQWYSNTGNRFYAGIGPYVGYGFSANVDTPTKTKLYKDDAWQEFDFGGKAMVGYEFANGIQINAAYRIGVINAVDKGEGKMLPQAFSLGVGYRF